MNQKNQLAAETESILKKLHELLTQVGIEIKYARGFFKGGLYRYHDKQVLYLNRASDPDNQISMIVEELKATKIDDNEPGREIKKIIEQSEKIRRVHNVVERTQKSPD